MQGDSAWEKRQKQTEEEKGSRQAGTEIYYSLHTQRKGTQTQNKHIVHKHSRQM